MPPTRPPQSHLTSSPVHISLCPATRTRPAASDSLARQPLPRAVELYSSLKGVHLSKAAGREKVRCLSRRLRSQQGGYVHMDGAYVCALLLLGCGIAPSCALCRRVGNAC